jgi:hypothetical protein
VFHSGVAEEPSPTDHVLYISHAAKDCNDFIFRLKQYKKKYFFLVYLVLQAVDLK